MTGTLHAQYFPEALRPTTRARTLRACARALRDVRGQFDGLVCTGVSGLLMAPTLADRLHCPLLVVRKADGHHSDLPIEGYHAGDRYVLVDDFVSTGATVQRVAIQLAKLSPSVHLVGVLSYRAGGCLRLSTDVNVLSDNTSASRQCNRANFAWIGRPV